MRRGSYCRYSVRAERVANPIMIMGCSSDAGKSFLVTALCRHLANRGMRVAPFKAQNMSNNAAVTPDGLEMGRAQYTQALAARTTPQAIMNPVLLKPNTDVGAQVIVHGKAIGNMDARRYHEYKRIARRAVLDAYARLASAHEAIVRALEMCAADAGQKSLTLRRHLAAKNDLLSGDGARLQQVIWNLLSNAFKFTPRGGTVEVRLESAAHSARVSVTDTGAGISKEFLPYVFDRFRQSGNFATRAQGGLGLGLSIVKYIVEQHGGTVRAMSGGEGQGSTFTVDLPYS